MTKRNEEKENALTVLRTETALSRFPLHLLTKGQGVQIELHNDKGAVYWNVSHNSKFGPPGQLAYKIDTLLVNRRIEEAGRAIPETIRLGTLPEISAEMGFHTHNWAIIRRALHQNASAYITAKISYRAIDGSEKWLEAGFTRYQVVFTGEKLPTGETANAVFIVLNSIYREVLNNAIFRPLDYDYMKTLPPISQRFYEIISYQIYAALKHKNPRAKLLYSDYCAYSTAKRYFDFDHVKKQMYKVLRPHVQSGYIAKVEYQATTNERGEADWWMFTTPGPNAAREYRAFTGQGQTRTIKSARTEARTEETLALPFVPDGALHHGALLAPVAQPLAPRPVPKGSPARHALTDELPDLEAPDAGLFPEGKPDAELLDAALVDAMVAMDLNRGDAVRFARALPEVCRRQLEFLPFVDKFKTSRGAYLRRAIEGDFGPPAAYLQAQEQEEAHKRTRAKRAQELFAANHEKARHSHEKRFSGAYLSFLRERVGEVEQSHPGAWAGFLAWEGEQRAVYFKPPFAGRPMNERALEVFDREDSHLERFVTFFRDKGAPLPTFWEWDETLNPEALRP